MSFSSSLLSMKYFALKFAISGKLSKPTIFRNWTTVIFFYAGMDRTGSIKMYRVNYSQKLKHIRCKKHVMYLIFFSQKQCKLVKCQ